MSNKEWRSTTDPEARIAKLKDGRTRMAYKPEYVVDLETGAILSAVVYAADRSDTETIEETLEAARENVEERQGEEDGGVRQDVKEKEEGRQAVVADKGYNKAAVVRRLKEKGYRTYIPERRQKGRRHYRAFHASHPLGRRQRVTYLPCSRGVEDLNPFHSQRDFCHVQRLSNMA